MGGGAGGELQQLHCQWRGEEWALVPVVTMWGCEVVGEGGWRAGWAGRGGAPSVPVCGCAAGAAVRGEECVPTGAAAAHRHRLRVYR